MGARRVVLLFLLVAACKTTPAPPPEKPTGEQTLSEGTAVPEASKPAKPAEPEAPCKAGGSACYTRAQAELDKDPKAGEALLEACVACVDAPAGAFRLLASAREDRGAKPEARACLREGITRYPSSDLLWLALARLELSTGRAREALSAYASAERLRPNDDALATEYRDVLERHGTDEERREAEVSRLVLEASGRAELDDLKGAEATLKLAHEKAGKVPRLLALVDLRTAMVLLRRAEPKAALVMLDVIVRNGALDPVLLAEVHVSRAEALLTMKRAKEAVKAADQAIVLEPKNVLAHTNRALALAASGDRDHAMESLKKACELGLSRRLTYQELMAIGPAIQSLKTHPEFEPTVRAAWPKAAF